MALNKDSLPSGTQGLLSREVILEQLRLTAGSRKLRLRGRNLQKINLSEVNLSGVDLSKANLQEANLRGADLSEANLREANLSGADLTWANLTWANLTWTNLSGANISHAILRAANLGGMSITAGSEEQLLTVLGIQRVAPKEVPFSQTNNVSMIRTGNISTINICIREEPLTALNMTTILATLTDLHTRCWLLAQGRFADMVAYSQTKTNSFVEEAHLVIEKITHNSPADFKFNLNADASPRGIAEALATAIDAVAQTPHRWQATKLENQLKELEIKKQSLETQEFHADKDQARQIEAQQAEMEKQRALLAIERQRVDIEKQMVELQKARWEFETQRLNYALETARKMVDLLQPEADAQTKTMLVQTLLPPLLQLGESKGLKLTLPQPTHQVPEPHKESAE